MLRCHAGSVETASGIAFATLLWWKQGCGCQEGIDHESRTDRPGGRDDHRRQSPDGGSQGAPDPGTIGAWASLLPAVEVSVVMRLQAKGHL